jgi:hypothetical protein
MYDIEKYVRMDWNIKKMPGKYREAAITGTILRQKFISSTEASITGRGHSPRNRGSRGPAEHE